MKTPREILLARHKDAEAKLDHVRRAVVSELNARAQSREDAKLGETRTTSSPASLGAFASWRLGVEKVWQELIWPCRRTWAGLAAVWLAILAFNHSQAESRPPVVARASTPPAEIRLALREQHRVLEEILGAKTPAPPAESPRRPNNQPRSERRALGMA